MKRYALADLDTSECGGVTTDFLEQVADGLGRVLDERPAVREVLGEDKDLTLVFHDNGLDRIAIGGVTIATKMKK